MVSYALLLPALLSVFFHRDWNHTLRASPLLPLTALFLLYMATVAVVKQGPTGLEFFKWDTYILLFIFAIGARLQLTEQQLAYLLTLTTLVAAMGGAYAIGKDIQSGQFWLPDYRLRGYATLYNELRSGFLFGAFALLGAWAALRQELPYWLRIVAAGTATLCTATTLLTGSRAPLLGLLVVAVWAAVVSRRWGRLLLIIAATVIVAYFTWDRLSERGASLRPEIWQYVWKLCQQQLWFGDGLHRYALEIPTSAGVKYNTHNLFLTILYYGGTFGLLLFLGVACGTFYQSWRDRHESGISLLAALLQFYSLVALQFDGVNLITRPADFWVLLWLPIALHLFGRLHILKRQPNCAAQ
jgi:O-antigen ligase